MTPVGEIQRELKDLCNFASKTHRNMRISDSCSSKQIQEEYGISRLTILRKYFFKNDKLQKTLCRLCGLFTFGNALFLAQKHKITTKTWYIRDREQFMSILIPIICPVIGNIFHKKCNVKRSSLTHCWPVQNGSDLMSSTKRIYAFRWVCKQPLAFLAVPRRVSHLCALANGN